MIALERKNCDTEFATHTAALGEVLHPDPPSWRRDPTWTPTKIADALALTAFDPKDPVLARDIIVTQGANAKSNEWKPVKTTIGNVLDKLITHEIGAKDGKAWVLADMVPGARTKNAVKAMYAVGLDIDTGMQGAVIDKALAELGCLAVRYTTHSHMKPETRVKKDLIIAWAMKHRPDRDADPEDNDLIRDFLQNSRHYDPAVAATAELRTFEHLENGIEAVIDHAPMAKHRAIAFLAEPFDIASEGKTQKEALERWRKVPQALARKLGDLPIDSTGSDPNRLFFLPRHAKGSPFEITLFGGPLLNWRDLTLDDPLEALAAVAQGFGGSKSVTPEGRALGRWSSARATGFAILDVLRDHAPEKIRHDSGLKAEIECPFDDDHSNSGDTDDRACFVVSAGEGTSEVFTVSCRHDGCRDKTNLDMLGKMIDQDWFDRDVIYQDQYDSLLADAEVTTAPPKSYKSALPFAPVTTDRRIFEGPAEAIAFWKQKAATVNENGKHRVAVMTRAGLQLMSETDACGVYKSFKAEWTEAKVDGRSGKAKLVPVSKPSLPLFLNSDAVRIFDAVDCDPSGRAPVHVLNTWEGLATTPRPGKCPLLTDHILKSVCGGDRTLYDKLMDWMADMFQNPARKPTWAPVLNGAKGAGKSTLDKALRGIIGRRHSVKVSQAKHLTGGFNAHHAGKLLITAEEVKARNTDASIVNDMITSEVMLLEHKGVDGYEQNNFARYIFISDLDHAIPAGPGERRYLFLWVVDLFEGLPKDHPEREAYFSALWDEYYESGREAFLHELLERDLSNFNPFGAPVTAGLLDQVERSLTDVQRWVFNTLADGQFTKRDGEGLGAFWPLDKKVTISSADMQAAYDSHVRRLGGSAGGMQAYIEALKPFGALRKVRPSFNGQRYQAYELAPRQEWQAAFTAQFGVVFDGDGEDI